MSRLGRAQPIPPVVLRGFLGNTPANFTTPTPILVVENVDRRRRYPQLDPFVYNSQQAAVSQPLPPLPVVVENLDRRRRYPPLDPFLYVSTLQASSLVSPPAILTVENIDRRRRYPPLDAFVYDSALAASGQNTGGFFRLFGP